MPKGHPTADRYPGVEFRDISLNRIEGYINRGQLANVLGCTVETLNRHIVHERLFNPDFYTRKAIFFHIDRIQELKAKWENRNQAFPVSGPVKGVITQFGMMLPRVRPKKEVLERLTLSRPKRRSRDSSWRTRKRYNLKDLKD
jgi:hypothetical protein